MRFDDRRTLKEPQDIRGGGCLPGERAECLDLRHEADARPLESLEGEGTGDVRRLGDPPGAHEAERANRAHELRPVHEREALLRLQAHGFETGARKRIRPGEDLALVARRPLADEGKREVRERREIARGADRAAAGHEREDALVQALEEELDSLDARSREPLGQRVRAQYHRGAHDLVGIRLPHPTRVAAQEAELQLLRELRWNRLRDEAAETGVDAVGVLAGRLRRCAVDERTGGGHPGAAVVGDRGGDSVDCDRPDIVDREIVPVQTHSGGDGHRDQV
jgi:hypothetical protein